MKKTSKFLVAVLSVAAVVASCQKPEFEEKVEMPKEEVQFAAVTEAGVATKMTLGTELKPEWQKSDQLAIYDGTEVNQFVVAEATGSYAVFNGKVTSGSDKFWAIFPYEEAMTYDASVGFKATIPAEQTVASGDSVSTTALMAMAYAERSSEGSVQFAFKNVCGLIQVTIPESGKISSVVISSNGEEKFAGTGTVKLQDGLPVFTPADGAVGSVTLRPEGDTFEAGNYYAAVAPVKFATGFSISLVRTDGATGTKSTDKVMEVVRSGGTNLKDVVAVSDWSMKIYTKEQLFAWAANWGKNDHVTLMADIDMENELWTPVGDFQGVFDGNDHKLYNFHVSRDGYCGLFTSLKGGVVKNLIIGSKDGETYDGASLVEYAHESSTSWSHIGSVAGFIEAGGMIENVRNFATVSIKDQNNPKCCFGGLVGSGNGEHTIRNCENHGAIVHNAATGQTTGASNHQCGGIIGKTDGKITIEGCKNYGTITIAGDKVDNVGGIIGNPNGASKANLSDSITGCYNYGTINITKTTSSVSPMAVGGIVGKLTGATVDDCHNLGTINSVCDVLTGMGGVVGMHKLEYESIVSNCSNGDSKDKTKGLMTFNPSEGTNQMVIGGILGYSEDCQGKLTVDGCTNYAPISTSYAQMRNIGGVVGAIGNITTKDGEISTIELLIDGCHNYGEVTIGGAGSFTAWQRHIGGIAGALYGSEAGVTVSGCTNHAAVSTTATGGGEHRMAGIVGHTRYGNITISECTNDGEIMATGSATNPRPAGIVSVTNAATSLNVTKCYNKKTITAASSVGTLYASGVAAYLLGPATISECYNQGEVIVTNAGSDSNVGGIAGQAKNATIQKCYNQKKISFSASKRTRIGGIVGNVQTGVTIDGCHNDTDGVVECTKAGATICVGGLAGRVEGQGVIVQNSTQSCAVDAKVANQSQYVGGLVGLFEGGNATGKQNELNACTNEGPVTITHGSTKDKYARAGGIAGGILTASNVKVHACENTSKGSVSLTSTNATTCHLGGILGYTHPGVECSSNENHAKVSGTNVGNLYVGGIWAYDDVLSDGYTAQDVKANLNFGEVYGEVSGAGKVLYAGGLFAIVRKVAAGRIDNDNANYGNVTCAGGALAGKSDIATWSAKVGKSVSVNGVAWNSAWAEGADTEDETKWLCPNATNALTATYVDAPAN